MMISWSRTGECLLLISEAMDHVARSGLVIFVDVHYEDILQRLHKMKVDRLVTHREGQSIADVLQYRRSFYEKAYDLRALCERFESVESVTTKIDRLVQNFSSPMNYASTRSDSDGKAIHHFQDVILRGLAEDGGLFVPGKEFPSLTWGEWSRLVELSFQERALLILERWLHPDFVRPQTLSAIIDKAYSRSNFSSEDVIPIVKLEENQYLMETFHGPTASFKDAALQIMPQLFEQAITKETNSARYLILVATSGDTGSAVLDGFSKLSGNSNVRVMVLYPEHGISSVQKALMTSVDSDSVKVIGVDGDFDSCQSAIKAIFRSQSVNERLMDAYNIKLSAANSINWGRLLPQVVYHASAYLDLVRQGVIGMGDECDVCIPTGNFGNILAAFYAREMGIPYKMFICASNVNNILTEFFQTGIYDLRQRKLQVSTSPAIDILKSSNLERFLHLVTGGDGPMIKNWFEGLHKDGIFKVPNEVLETISDKFNLVSDWCSEEQCAKTIRTVFKETGYLLDPHTSIAKTVADRQTTSERPMIICSTAHYGKFPEDVSRALQLPLPAENDDCSGVLQQLKTVSALPSFNQGLESAVKKPRVHNSVISDDMKNITREIETFCAEW
ncbi:threonine synthase-like 1 isoform X1 [Apostichopus japonicus]|uniref:threonine synthase-like 1 isoform X1 n=1 Tax=Stichopus japonicus TaxID=307972 RepID=UPI003AB68B92